MNFGALPEALQARIFAELPTSVQQSVLAALSSPNDTSTTENENENESTTTNHLRLRSEADQNESIARWLSSDGARALATTGFTASVDAFSTNELNVESMTSELERLFERATPAG